MTKQELLRELGKPTSLLTKGGREILIYPNNVRIELDQGRVVSVKGLDLAATEAAAAKRAVRQVTSDGNVSVSVRQDSPLKATLRSTRVRSTERDRDVVCAA